MSPVRKVEEVHKKLMDLGMENSRVQKNENANKFLTG